MILMLPVAEKKAKIIIAAFAIGMFACLYASQINGLIYEYIPNYYYLTTSMSPVVEELLKAIPVLIYALVTKVERKDLLTMAAAVGIGFAILENGYIMVTNIGSVDLFWGLIRAFGTGLMHGLCTAMIGYGMSFVHLKRKLFVCGTFALYAAAVMFHSIFNILVQSQYDVVGYFLPLLVYVPAIIAYLISLNKKK